jgi:hypothetical protein
LSNITTSLGAEKLTTLVGGIVGAIGTLLPFYSIPSELSRPPRERGLSARTLESPVTMLR